MYFEKQEAINLIEKMGWTYKIAAPKFGFDNHEYFRQFIKNKRSCVGIDFMRGLHRVRKEIEDV